jgi:general secretion pathway protein K
VKPKAYEHGPKCTWPKIFAAKRQEFNPAGTGGRGSDQSREGRDNEDMSATGGSRADEGVRPTGQGQALPDGRGSDQNRARKQAVFVPRTKRARRGSGLLAVLWLSAALAAIAFSLSVTVRGEIERTSTEVDGLRCGYLASAGIERAAMELLWSATAAEGKLIPKGSTFVDYVFPSGNVRVDIIPETAKLDVNKTSVEDLAKLVMALGVDPGRAEEIATAIGDWRQPGSSLSDGYYSGVGSSFHPSHASFREIEELLLVRGVTPDIFYGTYVPAAGGALVAAIGQAGSRLARRSGLIDCLSVYGTTGAVDVNTADAAVLAAIGVPLYTAQAIAAQRANAPFSNANLGELIGSGGAGAGRMRTEGNSMVTFRATARLRLADGKLSDLRRTSAALVKYMAAGSEVPYHVLRWYDTAWSD